jgi:uncharacterized protein
LKLFLDTSVLVKLFHDESGTPEVTSMVVAAGADVLVLELARLEFLSAVYRRLRAGEIEEDAADRVRGFLDEQLLTFQVLPLGKAVLREAEQHIAAYGREEGLRSLDALHLAAFTLACGPDWKFVCADKRLSLVVRKMGFDAVTPA